MADAVLTRKQHRRTEAERKDASETPAVAIAAAGHEGEDQMDTAHLWCVCYHGHHLVLNQLEKYKPSDSSEFDFPYIIAALPHGLRGEKTPQVHQPELHIHTSPSWPQSPQQHAGSAPLAHVTKNKHSSHLNSTRCILLCKEDTHNHFVNIVVKKKKKEIRETPSLTRALKCITSEDVKCDFPPSKSTQTTNCWHWWNGTISLSLYSSYKNKKI